MEIIEKGFIFKKINNNKKIKVNYVIKELDKTNLKELMKLQTEVYKDISVNDKHTYIRKTKNEFKSYFFNGAVLLGIYVNKKLIAARITQLPGLSEKNLGHILKLSSDKLLKSMHFKTILVRTAYRGNNLQVRTMKLVEKVYLKRGFSIGFCQISPDNYYSMNNALTFGLLIKKIILIDDNKKNIYNEVRCILYKYLSFDQPITFEKVIPVKNTDIERQTDLIEKGYVGFKLKKFVKINEFTILYGKNTN